MSFGFGKNEFSPKLFTPEIPANPATEGKSFLAPLFERGIGGFKFFFYARVFA
jgi:hypothetical protein